jgi:hypothetical protein
MRLNVFHVSIYLRMDRIYLFATCAASFFKGQVLSPPRSVSRVCVLGRLLCVCLWYVWYVVCVWYLCVCVFVVCMWGCIVCMCGVC